LEDQAAAEVRAEECSGVHYSFEKLDRITCSTVFGRAELLIDPQHYRNDLVSFGIDEEALQAARTQISGAKDLVDDDTAEAAEAAAAAAIQAQQEAIALAALASQARFDQLNAKRANPSQKKKR
jgi:hypothetical protein